MMRHTKIKLMNAGLINGLNKQSKKTWPFLYSSLNQTIATASMSWLFLVDVSLRLFTFIVNNPLNQQMISTGHYLISVTHKKVEAPELPNLLPLPPSNFSFFFAHANETNNNNPSVMGYCGSNMIYLKTLGFFITSLFLSCDLFYRQTRLPFHSLLLSLIFMAFVKDGWQNCVYALFKKMKKSLKQGCKWLKHLKWRVYHAYSILFHMGEMWATKQIFHHKWCWKENLAK